jgi:D-lyxose ketol-isomerase
MDIPKSISKGNATQNTRMPEGKEEYYTALKEIPLDAGRQHSIPPTVRHWFQAGPEGSVNLTFQKRVDESRNIFDDPSSTGCPIKPTD